MLNGLIKYAILWVRFDRRISGRARNIDVTDYRSGMKQQEINGKGEVSPTDRSDKMNGWIDWTVKAKSDDPALLASAIGASGDITGRVGGRVGLIVTGRWDHLPPLLTPVEWAGTQATD